jgi:putative membrane protein
VPGRLFLQHRLLRPSAELTLGGWNGGVSSSTTAETPAARLIVIALSALVVTAVGLVLYAFPRATAGGEPGMLPTVNALLNGSAAAFLSAGYVFIRKRQIRAHRACMIAAVALSSLFLVGYLAHHAQVGSVPFRGSGGLRALYLAILIPHVLLAAPVVPLALFTIWRGLKGNVPAHRRIARVTLPIWLYVSLSGVVIYWMLYHLGA